MCKWQGPFHLDGTVLVGGGHSGVATLAELAKRLCNWSYKVRYWNIKFCAYHDVTWHEATTACDMARGGGVFSSRKVKVSLGRIDDYDGMDQSSRFPHPCCSGPLITHSLIVKTAPGQEGKNTLLSAIVCNPGFLVCNLIAHFCLYQLTFRKKPNSWRSTSRPAAEMWWYNTASRLECHTIENIFFLIWMKKTLLLQLRQQKLTFCFSSVWIDWFKR